MRRDRIALLAGLLFASGPAAALSAAKSDFRGLKTGMTVAQATVAAAKAGMSCETSFNGQTTCRGGDASVVLATTGRRGNHVWELQVSLVGHYDPSEMRKSLEAFYGLSATTTPQVFDTASGQQLLLLEIGETSTIFYLMNSVVLHDDTAALPPPKL